MIILDGSEESLLEIIFILYRFLEMFGLCINYLKIYIVWIGFKKYSNDIFIFNSKLNWGFIKFILFGINFDVDLLNMFSINYDLKLVKIKFIFK